jgi:RNA polymerase sigma factor (sigma-70 family)
MTIDDMELVRQYAAHRSESAFAALVSRYTNLVYSASLRRVSDPQLAEEVTQAVFIILARKAGSFNEKTILSGWLYRTACFVSSSALKREYRRQQREQEAYMRSTLNEDTMDAAWKQMSPLLEEAMLHLGQTDRDALVLRFFEGHSLDEVGMAMGSSEGAAKKRVNRAVEKLRGFFIKRGVVFPATALTAAISANSVQAAPAMLAKTTTALALSGGATVSSSTLTLIKGALKVMAWSKAKTIIVIGAAAILVAGTTGLVVKHQRQADGLVPQNSLASADYATPEATFQSWRLAMSKGDLKGYLASFTPEGQNNYMKTVGQGKSESELVAMNIKIADMISDFQIASNEVMAPDEAILHFHSSRLGNASVPMQKIQGEWKINGNLTAGSNDRGH